MTMSSLKEIRKIVYVHDFRFYLQSGDLYTAVGLPESYFDRFFDTSVASVSLITRLKTVSNAPQGFERIKNSNISSTFSDLGYFDFFKPLKLISIIKVLKSNDFVVINYPSVMGLFCAVLCILLGRRYSLEFAADSDLFSSKKCGFLVTAVFNMISGVIASNASASIYVSEYLRNKYPNRCSVVCSNVKLESFVEKFKNAPLNEDYKILFAGGINRRKGIPELLKCLRLLKNSSNKRFELHIAGGHPDDDYEQLASELQVYDSVVFHGILGEKELAKLYRESDLYVQPSLSEGIPRATLEAMSYALPVVATTLPGFKEILDETYLVEPRDIDGLASKILEVISNPQTYTVGSKSNLLMSKEYSNDRLSQRRCDFYRKVFGNECS